jgi:hypothetical protein
VPRTVLGDVASWHRVYLDAKPSHVGVDVHGLAYPLHCYMAWSRQTRGQGCLPGPALSHHAALGGDAFPGDVRPPDSDI